MASAGFDLHHRQAVGRARAADAVALFADCGVGAEPFDDRVQGGDFGAAFVDLHILIGRFTAGALPVLVAAYVDQREGFAALIPVPYFFSDQYDNGMEYSGYAPRGGYDSVVFRGDVRTGEFIAFWLRDGRVLAGMNVNTWGVTDAIETLVRPHQTVDPVRVADTDVPLETMASS